MRNRIIILISLLCITFSSVAQMLYNSPYSRYGIGRINSSANAFQLGQGGLSYSTGLFNQVNVSNPASYPYIRKHSPIFDIAINGDFSEMTSSDTSQLYRNGSIANFTIGLPTSKRSGFVLSYQPFTNMGYNIVDSLIDSNGEDYANIYFGQGGINKLMAGFGYLVYRADSIDLNISLGINANYIYGNYFHQRTSDYGTGSLSNSLLIKDSTGVKDFVVESGLMIRYKPNNHFDFTLGLNYSFGNSLSAKNSFLAYTYAGNVSAVIDTILFSENASGFIKLPSSIGIALEANYKRKIGLGIQYTSRNWSQFQNSFGTQKNVSFENIAEFNSGLWYKPSGAKGNSNGGPLKNATFKTGFRTSNLGIVLNDSKINEMAVSAGIQLPLVNSGSFSSVNFGTEFGQRGSIANGLIQERFVQLRIGLSIMPSVNDRWFIKRKYD